MAVAFAFTAVAARGAVADPPPVRLAAAPVPKPARACLAKLHPATWKRIPRMPSPKRWARTDDIGVNGWMTQFSGGRLFVMTDGDNGYAFDPCTGHWTRFPSRGLRVPASQDEPRLSVVVVGGTAVKGKPGAGRLAAGGARPVPPPVAAALRSQGVDEPGRMQAQVVRDGPYLIYVPLVPQGSPWAEDVVNHLSGRPPRGFPHGFVLDTRTGKTRRIYTRSAFNHGTIESLTAFRVSDHRVLLARGIWLLLVDLGSGSQLIVGPPERMRRLRQTSVDFDGERIYLFGGWKPGRPRAHGPFARQKCHDPRSRCIAHIPTRDGAYIDLAAMLAR